MSDFNPRDYIIALKGRGGGGTTEYMPVAARLAWLRSEHPEATIETEMMVHLTDEAIFRAKVTLPSGASATGWGSETRADFPAGHVEKAETKSLGRALAALGFGTLQAGDDLDEGERIVDTPQPTRRNDQPPTAGGAQAAGVVRPISWTEVWGAAHKLGITDREQLAKHLGANPGGMDPATIYRLLVGEPAKEVAGMPAGVAG